MKTTVIAILAAITTATASATAPQTEAAAARADLERVERIRALGRMHSWHAIDNDTLIIWASAFDPYLIELAHPHPGLRFAHVIGVTESAGSVHSRFDSVLIEGFRHRIAGIYRLSAQDAKAMQANAAR